MQTVRVVFLLSIAFLLSAHPAFAQRYTYFGIGISLFAASTPTGPDSPLSAAPFLVDGGAYDVTLRQEINGFLSMETGISAHNLEYDYLFMDDLYVNIGAFPVHKIPLKVELEVNVFRDRIIAYGSFGYQFCIPFEGGAHGYTIYSFAEGLSEEVEMQWNYIQKRWYYSLYQVGAGLGIRLVDALLFEMELGYGFSLKDMVESTFTYLDGGGEEITYIHKAELNYWFLQGGFSYPIQRMVQGIKSIIE